MAKGQNIENDLLDFATGRSLTGSAFAGATNSDHYMRLYTAASGEPAASNSAGWTEASGNGYSAIALGAGTYFTSAPANGSITASQPFTWTASGGQLGGGTLLGWQITKGNTAGAETVYWSTNINTVVADGNDYELTVTINED